VSESRAPVTKGLGSSQAASTVNSEPYPLDVWPRTFADPERSCPEIELRDFAGAEISFAPAARVIEPFASRLSQFEHVVAAVARRFYERPPSKVLVASSYDCRSVSGKDQRLSEHALGNAIDISGFQFGASPDWPDTAMPLPGAFDVWVERHWHKTGDPAIERHARFLDALTRELLERRIFRTLLGPSHPDHADHFHFDMAPTDYVNL